MKRNSLCIVLGLALVFQPLDVPAQNKSAKKPPKDVILKTETVTGRFVGFETGDYVHALITPKKGETFSVFIRDYGLDYFLAVHAKKTGLFTIQTAKTYIEEAGGVIEIDRVTSAKFGKTTFAGWWKATRKSMTPAQIDKKYEPLVRKLTKGS